MSEQGPSVTTLAGQLGYLFEDEPGLRNATPEALTARLNHDDRTARARSRDPIGSDADIEAAAAKLDERISVADVREALERTQQDP